MWNYNMWLVPFSLMLLFTIIKSTLCSSCQLPSEDNMVSICAFCSDYHAGVGWMLQSKYALEQTESLGSIEIRFYCNILNESVTYSHDDCFNGIHLPRLSSIPAVEHDVWRWHALERRFNVGTKCTFRAVIKNVWSEETSKLYSSCIVGEDDGLNDSSNEIRKPPVVCYGSQDDSVCSCNCGQDFTEQLTTAGLLCSEFQDERSKLDSSIINGSESQDQRSKLDSSIINGTEITDIIIQSITTTGIPQSRTQSKITAVFMSTTIIVLMLALAVVVTLARLILTRGKNNISRTNGANQFDPQYNPVTITDKETFRTTSLHSTLNSLLYFDESYSMDKEYKINPEIESCLSMSSLDFGPGNTSSDEQKSTYSQSLGESDIKPPSENSTFTLNMTDMINHKDMTHQNNTISLSLNRSAEHLPQNLGYFANGYKKLDILKNRYCLDDEACSHKENTISLTLQTESGTCIYDCECKLHGQMNSNSSGYSSCKNTPSTNFVEVFDSSLHYQYQTKELHSIFRNANEMPTGNSVTCKGGIHILYYGDDDTPVFFEFPQEST